MNKLNVLNSTNNMTWRMERKVDVKPEVKDYITKEIDYSNIMKLYTL